MGRPPHGVRRYHASFSYHPASWSKPRGVVAKVGWRPGEWHSRAGFIVTNMTWPPGRVTLFYNQRGTAEQHVTEGKNAVTWMRPSCHRFAANAVRLQLVYDPRPNLRSDSNHRPMALAAGVLPGLSPLQDPSDRA